MLLVGWTADGKQESLIITCDGCGEVISSLEAAWLAYPMLAHVQDRAALRWMHRPCAERVANGNGMPRLWRADHALKALMYRKATLRACKPTTEASEARRLTPSAADKVLLERLNGQRWTAEELHWVATHLDPLAPLVVEQRVLAKLRELEPVQSQVIRS